jgi:hypothetical protein
MFHSVAQAHGTRRGHIYISFCDAKHHARFISTGLNILLFQYDLTGG